MNQYLVELRLEGFRGLVDQRLKEARKNGLSHDEFLNLVLYDEIQHRREKKKDRLQKAATFKIKASLENIDYKTQRGLSKKSLSDLSSCRFIEDSMNINIFGPTGVGKSYLACAIGRSACSNGFTTLFFSINKLLEQVALARAQGRYLLLLKRLTNTSLLILDDFGIKPLIPAQYQDLFDIIDERYEGKSTIITSQVPPENWAEIIDDPVVCEAITDRLTSKAYTFRLDGDSQRKKHKSNARER